MLYVLVISPRLLPAPDMDVIAVGDTEDEAEEVMIFESGDPAQICDENGDADTLQDTVRESDSQEEEGRVGPRLMLEPEVEEDDDDDEEAEDDDDSSDFADTQIVPDRRADTQINPDSNECQEYGIDDDDNPGVADTEIDPDNNECQEYGGDDDDDNSGVANAEIDPDSQGGVMLGVKREPVEEDEEGGGVRRAWTKRARDDEDEERRRIENIRAGARRRREEEEKTEVDRIWDTYGLVVVGKEEGRRIAVKEEEEDDEEQARRVTAIQEKAQERRRARWLVESGLSDDAKYDKEVWRHGEWESLRQVTRVRLEEGKGGPITDREWEALSYRDEERMRRRSEGISAEQEKEEQRQWWAWEKVNRRKVALDWEEAIKRRDAIIADPYITNVWDRRRRFQDYMAEQWRRKSDAVARKAEEARQQHSREAGSRREVEPDSLLGLWEREC